LTFQPAKLVGNGGRQRRIGIGKPDAGPGPGLREGFALQPHGTGCDELDSPSVQHPSARDPVRVEKARLPACIQATAASVASATKFTAKPIEQLIKTAQTDISRDLTRSENSDFRHSGLKQNTYIVLAI